MANYNKKNKDFMRKIAAKGGRKTLKNRGLQHYSTIGKLGIKAMRKKLSTFEKPIA